MAVLLALITSALWGTSDFFGGLATRRTPVFRVMMWVHGIGLGAVAIAAPFIADEVIGRDLVIGAVAGLFGLAGMLLLYWALSAGPMAVVAPLSALASALVPVVGGFLLDDETMSTRVILGLVLGLIAVVIISYQGPRDQDPRDQDPRDQDPRDQDPRDQDPRDAGSSGSVGHGAVPAVTPQVLGAAVLAGAGFGSLILLYDQTSEASAPWPVVSGRLVTTLLLVLFAVWQNNPLSPGDSLGFAAIAGLGDTFANVTLLLATTTAVGSVELSIVGVVAAFYPAATVLWARFALNEPLGPIRLFGLALGFSAITLMALA